jgi:predicted type IV restriction endonuclease
MGITERVEELALKVHNQKANILTEEATKNAFVMPFINSVLGYDVFNPSEVIPEFVADVGIKKGEKVDYALMQDGEIQILIEAKKVTEPLDVGHGSQLFRYFSVTKARIAILTNGEVYEFYTDLDSPNVMDNKPFLVLDLADIDETLLPEVAKLTKESFDLDSVVSAAGELKYIGQIKRMLTAEFKDPSESFLNLFFTQIYPGKRFVQRAREEFTPLMVKAINQFLNEQVNDRLKSALGDDRRSMVNSDSTEPDSAQPIPGATVDADADSDSGNGIVTTDEELEGYRIVRAIVCSEVAATRVVYRDSKTYFAILLDDNRKTIARLWFNRKQKYLGVFDADKKETKLPIASPEGIYEHASLLRSTVANYLASNGNDSLVASDLPLRTESNS